MSRRITRNAVRRILGAFICAVVFAFPAAAVAQKAPSPNLVILHVATTAVDEVTPVLYAVQHDLFKKAGLDVRIEPQSSGSAVAAALIGGSYEIGKMSVTTLFDAHGKGLPLTIVAPDGMYDSKAPLAQLIVAKDSSITKARDFNGKLVAVNSLDGIGRVAFDAWMRKNGGDPLSVHYVEVSFPLAEAAVEQHRFDAMAGLVEPYLSKALASGKVRAVSNFDAAIAPSFLYTAWVANTDWAAKHSEAVKAFARVVAESAAYTNANPAATAAMVSAFTGVPVEAIRHMTRAVCGTTLNEFELQPTIDAAARDGVLKHTFPARELIDSDVMTR